MDTSFGIQQKGKRNLITDVAGITVGHCMLADGDVQTGVTALLPHQGDLFHDRCPAAVHVINGFGKSAGLVQVQELGYLETPLILTNTLSVGTAFTACVRYMLARNDQIGRAESTVNPVILECNDGYLNDIRGLHVTEDHVFAALDAADTAFVDAKINVACRRHIPAGVRAKQPDSLRTVFLSKSGNNRFNFRDAHTAAPHLSQSYSEIHGQRNRWSQDRPALSRHLRYPAADR